MTLSPEGRVVLSNLLYDLRHGDLEKDVVCSFLQRLADSWAAYEAEWGEVPDDLITKLDPAMKVFDAVRDEMEAKVSCLGRPQVQHQGECSTIMPSIRFMKIIKPTSTGFTRRGEPRECMIVALAELKSVAEAVLPGATMPPNDPVKRIAWVTPTKGIRDIRRTGLTGAELAEALRARLGLIHHVREHLEDPHYVEVCYPANAFTSAADDTTGRLVPPTVFDGGSSRVYRSQRNDDGWGVTVDLHGYGEGLPEAVHLPIPVEGEFKVREVGRPTALKVDVDFEKLADSAPERWTAECIDEIQSACSCP